MAPPPGHLYLSPHLDDVAWSAGGAVALLVSRGGAVDVLTVCAGIPDAEQPLAAVFPQASRDDAVDAAALVRKRREEDRIAMGVLGAVLSWGSDLDAIYRNWDRYGSLPALVGDVADDDPLVARVATLIERTAANSLLHAPLGIGGHVDHRILSDGAFAVSPGRPVAFYEDFPYVVDFPNATERRLAELGRTLEPIVLDVSEVVEKRWRALRAYRSQLGAFADAVRAKADAYARSLGGGVPSERIWVPPQWESLVRSAFGIQGGLE